MFKMWRRAAVCLMLGLFCLSVTVIADEPQQPGVPADGGSSLKAPDGTPQEILVFINQNMRNARTPADWQVLIVAAERAYKHPDANDMMRRNARNAMLNVHLMAARTHATEMGPKFQAFVDKVVAEEPQGEFAGAALAARWNLKHGMTRTASPESSDEVRALIKKFPKNPSVVGLVTTEARKIRDDKEAVAFLKQALETIGTDSPLGQRLEGMIVNRQLMGSTMEFSGPTLKGDSFDLASYRGKVVLVDFWATWCGPCIAEMPHVKKVYAKYHDQGFEIVAISLDSKRETLADYVAKNDMPWVQIIFSAQEDMGWANPLARKFGINSIPATFLVGRDGRVVARDLRGEAALEKAVADALQQSPEQAPGK
ncbi:MAG TPA: TlpA disulfide reductase family protein [Gemmatales bacterium]|nr:TlpA disulfide reductase family protein [Gemmatales bacterium]HMP60640.1 TlpA disulfide reductase family protein [Gemmatales bacterium]